MHHMRIAAVLALSAAFPVVALADDRSPNAQERTAIEAALKTAGYSGWKEIELDDGKWEVDNAKAADGKVYDLKLASGSYEVVSRKIDD